MEKEMAKDRSNIKPISVGMADAAAMIGVSRSRMYELDAEGQIRTVKVGGRKLVIVASLLELLGEAA
jgi:hypothetical protein